MFFVKVNLKKGENDMGGIFGVASHQDCVTDLFFGIDYQFNIPDDEAKKLEIENSDDIFVCNIANIPSSNPQGVTINMLAPIVINLANKKAMQIVLKNTNFQVRYKLFENKETEE